MECGTSYHIDTNACVQCTPCHLIYLMLVYILWIIGDGINYSFQ